MTRVRPHMRRGRPVSGHFRRGRPGRIVRDRRSPRTVPLRDMRTGRIFGRRRI